MKRRMLSIICVLALCLSLLPATALADDPTDNWTDNLTSQPSGYTVDDSGNVTISTAEGLAWLAVLVNGLNDQTATDFSGKTITLEGDIDLSAHYWTPIGTSTSNYFKGTFDGADHTISNLTIDTKASYVGLFGSTSGAVIKNVTLDNPQVQNSAAGTSNTGALVGYMVGNGTVEYCAVTNGSVSSDGQHVGGLIGYIYAGTVQYCYNYETTVSSTNDTQTYVNGVAGRTGNYTYLCSSFSYVSNQKELKASNTANYAAYLSDTPTERAYGINGDQHGFTADQFQDGTVAYFLRTGFYSGVKYENWGQTLGTDTLPEWNGEAVESLKYAHLGDTGTAVDAYAYFNALTPDDNGTYHIEDTSGWIAFVKLVKEDKNYSANAVVKEGAVIDFSQFGTLTNKSTYSYLVIADYYSNVSYTGTFTGNGCTVKGVSYSGAMEFALFGTIGEDGSVSGITLEEPKISGTTAGAYNIAGIASHNYGTIDDCHVDGGTISTVATTAAGIAAESFGTVSNCTNSADITAKYEVAGIVATSNSTNGNTSSTKLMKIEGCSNSGTITATYAGSSHAGGIFGGQYQFSNRGYPYGTISKCFNTGNILGQSYIGGIVGYSIKNANASAANVTIENCYNTGAIGDDRTTGVAGGISAGTNSSVTNCFNVGAVTGTNAQPIVANGYNTQAWSVNSYASCDVTGPSANTTLYYGEDDGNQAWPKDEQGRYCRGSGKRTNAEMASGEVAYLLQQGQTDPVWSQQIGVDKHPVLVINGEPAPVVLITVMLVNEDGETSELTKCYTNAGSTLSAYPTPDDPGAVYTFYTEVACTNKIDTTKRTYDGDATIYAKVTKLTEVDVSGIDVSGKPYDGSPVSHTGSAKAMNGDTDVTTQVKFDYAWYSVSGSSETLLPSAPADAGSYKLVVSVVSNTYTGQQVVKFEITQKEITAAVIGSVTKEYDGNMTVPSENDLSIELKGLVEDDTGEVTASAGSYAYGSAEISSGITITANNVTLSGDRASNYLLTGTVTGSVGNITAIQIKELTSPTAPVLTEYYSNASEVIAELPTTTTGTTTSGGSVSVTLEWNFSGTSYNSAPGATNSFTWTATAPENYEFASGVDTTGEITVTNKSADSPTITGTNQAVTYDGNAIDVSTMFSGIPAGSNPTYSIVEGSDTTGEGTLSDTGDLTVTKAGDFKIKVTTQASGNYTAGEATATLTVNKGSFTATVYMRNYAQGGTPSTPSVSGNKSGGTVTYYYNTTDTTGGGTEWTTDRGKTLAAGTYYMYAVIAETDLYNSCTTSATSFRVIDAAAGIVEPTARDLTYTGKSQELIEPGSIAGGTMVYSLSENGEYSETIPTRINAGTYYVWYKAEGDTQAIDKVSVTIQKAVIVSLNIPETYQLTKPYSSGDDVLDLLQSLYDPAVGTTKDGGEIPVNVPWWGRDIVFDSRPGKTNNFTWSIIITGSYVPQNYTFQADMIGSDGNVSGEIVVYNIPEEGAYTVTLNNVGTGFYGAGSYAAGTEVTIHAGDREGYVFIGWSTEDMVLNDPCSPVTTFTMPDCDVVVEALWYKEEPSHSVTLPTWDVIVEDCSHGTVEPWPEEAKMTTTITVTVTPDKGYELGSLIVTDESGNELELTDKGDGVFTFRMPNSDVTIEVTFQPVSDSSTSGDLTITAPAGWVNPYIDVAANAWYYNAVGYASANGLMSGTSATTFSPNTAMTRAMIVTVLARFAGVDTTTGDTWYDAGQQWAVANGISDGTALDRDITRQELVTMLWRYAGSPAMNVPELALIGSYPDSADVSAWAQNAFAWAISKGIIEGRDGLLAPDSGATRAEAATILARFHLLTK